MSIVETKRRELQQFFSQRYTRTPVAWENVAYTPNPTQAWVSFKITNTRGNFASVGIHARVRREGLINITVYVPKDTGTKAASEIADTITEIFENNQISDFWLFPADIVSSGNIDEWYSVAIIIRFEYDEYRNYQST